MKKSMVMSLVFLALGLLVAGLVVLWLLRANTKPISESSLVFTNPNNAFVDITNPLQIAFYDSNPYKSNKANKIDVPKSQELLKKEIPIFIIFSSDIPGIPATLMKVEATRGYSSILSQTNYRGQIDPRAYMITQVNYLWENARGDASGILSFLVKVLIPKSNASKDTVTDYLVAKSKTERVYIGTLTKEQWTEITKVFDGNVSYSLVDDLDR